MSTLGSLFDGSGGFPLAGALSGITPLWASEIEPYPIAVTTSRFPQMKHLGNVAEVDGRKIPPVDIITFGSPCQDMSVAGKRVGMKHREKGDNVTTRSGLFYEAIRIIREMREATNGRYPTFAIWENVPGAFSSNGGEDFRCVLEEFAKICGGCAIPRPANGKWRHAGEIVGDGFSIAWRVLDAQYWGVPQRRKRIYLVADFAGGRAGKILFERESVLGNPAQGGAQREDVADDAAGGAGGSDRVKCLTPWDCQSKRIYLPDGVYPTLAAMDCGGANNQALIYEPLHQNTFNGKARPCVRDQTQTSLFAAFMGGQGSKSGSIGYSEQVSPTLKSVLSGGNTVPDVVYPEKARTLTAMHDSSPCADRGQNVVTLDCRNLIGNTEVSGTLQAKNEGGFSLNFVNPVVYDCRGNGSGDIVPNLTGDHENRVTDYTAICVGNGQLHQTELGDKTGALNCMHDQQAVVHSANPPRRYIVRRLTPLECCRLQGFPDGWGVPKHKDAMDDCEVAYWEGVRRTYAEIAGKTYKPFATRAALVKWYNGLHTDSAEYKMWGNGVALPCAYNVVSGCAEELRRICHADAGRHGA